MINVLIIIYPGKTFCKMPKIIREICVQIRKVRKPFFRFFGQDPVCCDGFSNASHLLLLSLEIKDCCLTTELTCLESVFSGIMVSLLDMDDANGFVEGCGRHRPTLLMKVR